MDSSTTWFTSLPQNNQENQVGAQQTLDPFPPPSRSNSSCAQIPDEFFTTNDPNFESLRTPRTVKLVSYDNYSFTPSKFTLFPNCDYDTLDLSNQNYTYPASSPFHNNIRSHTLANDNSFRIYPPTSTFENNNNTSAKRNKRSAGLSLLPESPIQSNKRRHTDKGPITSRDIPRSFYAETSSDPIQEYSTLYDYNRLLNPNSPNAHINTDTLGGLPQTEETGPNPNFPYLFQLVELGDTSDAEILKDENKIDIQLEEPNPDIDSLQELKTNDINLILSEKFSQKSRTSSSPTEIVSQVSNYTHPSTSKWTSITSPNDDHDPYKLNSASILFRQTPEITSIEQHIDNFHALIPERGLPPSSPLNNITNTASSYPTQSLNDAASQSHTFIVRLNTPKKKAKKRQINSEQNAPDENSHGLAFDIPSGIEPDDLIKDFSYKYNKAIARINIPSISPTRYNKIKTLSGEKHLDANEVDKVLSLFKQRNYDLKLKVLSKVVGTAFLENRGYPTHTSDDGLVVTEGKDGSFTLMVKTYAGSDASVSTLDDSIVSYFKNIKDFSIYFRQPNEPTTYKSKNNMLQVNKRKKTGLCMISAKLVKRPLNSFMLYRTTMVKAVVLLSLIDTLSTYAFHKLNMEYANYDPNRESVFLKSLLANLDDATITEVKSQFRMKKFNHHLLIQIVSLMWSTEVTEIKNGFYDIAKAEKEIHAKCFPSYKYRPNRATAASTPTTTTTTTTTATTNS